MRELEGRTGQSRAGQDISRHEARMCEGVPVHSKFVWIELFIAKATRHLCARGGFAILCFHDLTGRGRGVWGTWGKRERVGGTQCPGVCRDEEASVG